VLGDPTRGQLQRGYELLKTGRRTQALHVLQQIILDDAQNVNAWWLMAHAVESPTDKQVALGHVLDVNPAHAGARRMMAELREHYPELAGKPTNELPLRSVPAKRPRSRRPIPPRRSRVRAFIIIMVAVVVLVVALLLASILLASSGLLSFTAVLLPSTDPLVVLR
jgi:ferric-dicitrate binding protein FerR (iron transport regulator)